MTPYTLVLRDKHRGTARSRVRKVVRALISIGAEGLVSPVGPSVLDVVDNRSGTVIARWDDPPRADGATVWLPQLQDELQATGLTAFAEKYGLRELTTPEDR